MLKRKSQYMVEMYQILSLPLRRHASQVSVLYGLVENASFV